jgi:hypothetical protein
MSSAVPAVLRPVSVPTADVLRRDPAAQAFLLLRLAFTLAPILFGLDKFAEVLTDDWTRYLASEFGLMVGALTLARLAAADFGRAPARVHE